MEDIEVIFMDSLQDVLDYFHGTYQQRCCIDTTQYQKEETEEDFSDIIGQKHLKRAIEIAVTGRHHLLIIGSPGSGKQWQPEEFRQSFHHYQKKRKWKFRRSTMRQESKDI